MNADLLWLQGIQSAKTPQRLPVVLTRNEVAAMLEHTDGTSGLILRLVYGTGMRITECLRLRVKDVDFEKREIVIREGKGFKDRMTMLPQSLQQALCEHLRRVALLHKPIYAVAMVKRICHTRCPASIPLAASRGLGNMSFLRHAFPKTLGPLGSQDIMPTRKPFNVACARLYTKPIFIKWLRRIHCGIRLQRICCKPVTIFARCRNCWATKM